MPKVSEWLKKLYRNFAPPKNLVRLCRRPNDLSTLVNEAISYTGSSWSQELIDRVIQEILEGGKSGISVYRCDVLDPFDLGHTFGVIAEGISQDDFRFSKGKRRKTGCTRACLTIPTTSLPKTTRYKFTPENNLNFYPANDYHFDLDIGDATELAIAILDGIRRKNIAWTFLSNEKGTYKLQATIAYSHCLILFGKLNPSKPPSNWIDGQTLTAKEQIETLMHLAQIKMIDSPKAV